jgi:hypothetical protein
MLTIKTCNLDQEAKTDHIEDRSWKLQSKILNKKNMFRDEIKKIFKKNNKKKLK